MNRKLYPQVCIARNSRFLAHAKIFARMKNCFRLPFMNTMKELQGTLKQPKDDYQQCNRIVISFDLLPILLPGGTVLKKDPLQIEK